MLGSKALEAVLGTGIDNRNHEAVRATIRSMADLGLSVLFIYPGSKMPADLRTPRQRTADDKIAQEAAQAANRRDWANVKSPSGLALATSDKAVLDRYLKRYIQMFSTWCAYDTNASPQMGDEVPWTKKAEDAGEIIISEPAVVNLAVEVGGSGIVVIDCDTRDQMRRWFEVAMGPDFDPDPNTWPAPTILTPGQVGSDTSADPDDPTTWAHADGGHFWFTVPDKYLPVLPRHLGAMTWGGDHGFAVLWDRRYVLVPPSTRAEGVYEFLGKVYDLPSWLADEIIKAGERRVQRAEMANGARTDRPELADRVDAWAESISWANILEPLGWIPHPRTDACGCAVWTAPGNHASPKSATAHDTGCSAGRYSEVNAPLYIWTDHDVEPFDDWLAAHGQTISKLQAVAVINYGGNVGKAMDSMGITPDLSVGLEDDLNPKAADADLPTLNGDGDFSLPETPPRLWCHVCQTDEGEFQVVEPDHLTTEIWHRLDPNDPEGHLVADSEGHRIDVDLSPADLPVDIGKQPKAEQDSPYPDEVDEPDPDVFDSPYNGVPRIAPFSHWRDMPPPEFIIDGLMEHGGLSCIIGCPGIGKSTLALDMACHIATGKRWQGRTTLKTRVLYLPGEGLSGAVQRIKAWEAAHDVDLADDLLLGNGIIQVAAQNEAWGEVGAYIARQGIGLVIFDTFARMSAGLEENSATDVGRAIKRFDKIKELTNAGVCVVHHTSKGAPDVARGSSALNGALDSELLVRAATWDTTQIADANGRYTGKAIELWTNKQKNAEQIEYAIPLLMVGRAVPSNEPGKPDTSTPLITGPNGNIDPMQGDVVLARPLPETVVETSIRIRGMVDGLPQQGASKSEIVLAVRPDAYARSRADTPAYWKQRIIEAVDRGLRYQLIETLTGTPSGARYIPSVTTPDQARALAAAEVTDAD